MIGLDLGTANCKAVLFDPDGQVRAKASDSYQLQIPHPSWAEQDVKAVWGAVQRVLRSVASEAPVQPERICISGAMHSLFPVADDAGTPFYKHFEHNGVTGPNIANTYSDRGQGVRPPVVFYNRSNEAAAQLKPGDFDWDAMFPGGVRWFHSGGIFAALSETTGELIIKGMKCAKAAGAVTSFDLNYRAKLWNLWGGHDVAVKVLKRIVEHVDVLVGNEEDLQLGLGIPGPKVAAKSKLDLQTFFGTMDDVKAMHPQVKIVATRLRDVHSTNRHSWAAVAWIDGKTYVSPTLELDVLDRIGGGDGYAAGLFYGLLAGEPEQEAVNLGWAHGA